MNASVIRYWGGLFSLGHESKMLHSTKRGSLPRHGPGSAVWAGRHCLGLGGAHAPEILLLLLQFFLPLLSLSPSFLYRVPLSHGAVFPSCLNLLQGYPKPPWDQRICFGPTFFLLYYIPLLAEKNAFLTSLLSQLLGSKRAAGLMETLRCKQQCSVIFVFE